MNKQIKTFQYKLMPTKEQVESIHQTLNLCRWLYNTGLEQRIVAYKKQRKTVSLYAQRMELPQLKKELPLFKGVHSQVLQQVLERLDNAFQAFFRRLKAGEKAGFPRFQGANRYHSFTYVQSGFTLNDKFLKLSKIGNIRIKCHRPVKGVIKTCTVIHKNGAYYACFACEIDSPSIVKAGATNAVGIDVGVKHLAITSDGDFHENPKHLRSLERKLKSAQRKLAKKKKGSARRKKAVRHLAKLHELIANKRKDTAHKTSRKLVNRYDVLVFENLNVQGMLKNKRLSKSIADSGWRQLIQFTTYKAENAGKQVVLVNPYNTTQRCSKCQILVKKTLKDRIHACSCGYTADRDVNAAQNILQLGLTKIA